jgi:hypothetical protein
MPVALAFLLVAVMAGPAAAASCGERIAFVRSVIDQDRKTGFIGEGVYEAMRRDLEAASRLCRAGGDAQAQLLVSATQSRHGYPVR